MGEEPISAKICLPTGIKSQIFSEAWLTKSLVTEGFEGVISRLGGRAHIEKSARETRAFLRVRGLDDALVLLRLILAYCLGGKGLRLTAAWAASLGVADAAATVAATAVSAAATVTGIAPSRVSVS